MDRKTLQDQINYFKRELRDLKCPQGSVSAVTSYYQDMYDYGQGLKGIYTITFSSASDLAPIINLRGDTSSLNTILGKYDPINRTQKLFILSNSRTLAIASTREIISVVKD